MITNRILLFGGSGQIGRALQKLALTQDWELKALSRTECDFMQGGSIGKSVHEFMPNIVINAAALTDIEACEREPERAREINFHAVANIAAQCATYDAPLIQLSTDYVFDGASEVPYQPDDAMNPLNIYGQTKMMGEEAARHGIHWHVILRTSLVFSSVGNNVLTKFLHQIDTQDEVQGITDIKSNPTSAAAVAAALITITNAILSGKGNGFGTYHFCGPKAVTRYELLEDIMHIYAPLTKSRPKLIPIHAREAPSKTPRPPTSSLNCDKLCHDYGLTQSAYPEDLVKAVHDYAAQGMQQ